MRETTQQLDATELAEIEAGRVPTTDNRPRGFPGLPCLYCDESGCIDLDLSDVTGGEAIRCSVCGAKYSVADVLETINAWLPVLKWIEAAPVIEE